VGEVSSKVNSTSLAPVRKAAEEIALFPLDNYEEIVTRPLFRPSRRPPDPEEAEAKSQQEISKAQQLQIHIKDLFALNGVVVTDKKAVALLQDIKNNKSLRVSEGEKLEGWQIKQISPDSVLFSNNGRSEALELIRNFEPAGQKLSPRELLLRRQRAAMRRQ
jgi:general secretion pathway protein N